jgi:hypothetical protein
MLRYVGSIGRVYRVSLFQCNDMVNSLLCLEYKTEQYVSKAEIFWEYCLRRGVKASTVLSGQSLPERICHLMDLILIVAGTSLAFHLFLSTRFNSLVYRVPGRKN